MRIASPKTLLLAAGCLTGLFGQATPRRLDAGRFHGIVRLDGVQRPGELAERGLTVLQATPDAAVVSGPIEAAGAAELLEAPVKISRELQDSDVASPVKFLAEFYADVSEGDMRTIADREGLAILEHPDLLSNHLMLEGPIGRIERLALWDEVAYVWPASKELSRGEPVRGCAGALTEYGSIGQYVATIGNGWDGAGLGAATLSYSIQQGASGVSAARLAEEIERALSEWARVVRIEFRYGGSPQLARHLNFLFTRGAHGDPYPFDGRGRVLAHTFYPAPPNPEPLAGDLHFDDDENWQLGPDTDVYSVVLHELGHALGLGHSDKPSAVMYTYYRRADKLTDEDIKAIRSLYAARESEPPANPGPEPTPTLPPPAPGPEVPPSTGTDRTAPSVTVVQPGQNSVITVSDKIAFKGTARDNIGVALVTWWTSTGSSGKAIGTSNWSTPEIPLYKGVNYFKITAYDRAGNNSSKSIVVTRR